MWTLSRRTSRSSTTRQILEPSGKGYLAGGAAVEGQALNIRKVVGPKGPYYQVYFKLRQPVWSTFASGGDNGQWTFNIMPYDEKKQALVDSGNAATYATTRQWSDNGSEMHLVSDSGQYAYMGAVYAKIYPTKGETVTDALKRVLDKAKKGLGNTVLSTPTDKEREALKLTRLLWSINKKAAEGMTKSTQEDPAEIKKLLKDNGVDDETISAVQEVRTMDGHLSHILPGRWKSIGVKSAGQAPVAKFVTFGGSTPSKFVNQIKTGLLSVHERALQGLGFEGASAPSDVTSGGADSTMTRVMTQHNVDAGVTIEGANDGVFGDICAIIAPDVMDRLDCFIHVGDSFGSTNNSHGGAWKNLPSMDKQIHNLHANHELLLRNGIPGKSYLGIAVRNAAKRDTLVREFKKNGIDEINGTPVESFIFVGLSDMTIDQIHKKVVQPAGY